jgi:nifR3 family TIM-barrel protein
MHRGGYDGVMQNFWKTLPKPCMVLAPMADVTDTAFRRIIAKYGKPDVFWTEFVSADGLYHTREIQKIPDSENPLMKDLLFDETERPIVAQIFSSQPEMIAYASALVLELGFDGVDINMGCPHRAIEKQGAGAAIMKNPDLARKLIQSAKQGTQGKIPVSVKTRIGYNKDELKTWLPVLIEEKPDVITVHARTRKELSEVPARWEHVKVAVEMRNSLSDPNEILIFGNGDVRNLEEARQRAEETGADGVMIGRGIFGNPWLFSEHTPTIQEKINVLGEHCLMFETLCGHKSFAVMKKHFGSYITGFKGAKELRIALYECENVTEVLKVLKSREVPSSEWN